MINSKTELEYKRVIEGKLKTISNDLMVIFIILKVETVTGVKFSEFTTKSRKRFLTVPRQMCMYFIKQNTRYPLELIGSFVGKRDHATVLHSIKTILNLSETDRNINILFNKIDVDVFNFKKPTKLLRTDVFKQLLYKYVTSEVEINKWLKKYTNTI